jgi:hypothetical protein
MRDSKIFDEAVATYFEAIAKEFGLHLNKVQDGMYEIPSPYFILRIRLDTGHRRGFNVLLRPASYGQFDENVPGDEYGLASFMEFYGEDFKNLFIDVDSEDDFMKQAQLLAQATKRYGIPYLLGNGRDFDAIKEAARKASEEGIEQIKKYRFPKNVREEWRLPEDD